MFKKTINKFFYIHNRQLSSNKNVLFKSSKDIIKTSFNVDYFEISNLSIETHPKRYPYIWLRDYCKCKNCYDQVNNQTLVNLKDISLDVKPVEISNFKENETRFSVTWTDGHFSLYDLVELSDFAFENEIKKKKLYHWNKLLIDKKLDELKFNYTDYLSNDDTLRKSLGALTNYGFMIVNNIPASIEQSKMAIERISYIQKTLYGEITILTANGDREDSAYSNVALKAHTDCTYLKNAPGLEIFQLLKHDGTGGQTLLVDGFYCAQKLKEQHPDEFEALTRINVKAVFKETGKYEMTHVDPVIKLNPSDSSLQQIRYNPYDRGVLNYLTYDETRSYYAAIRKFAAIIENSDNELWLQLKEGELLFFDNFRLLHGRSRFNGERQLLTAYVSRDDWISKATVLNK